VALASTAWAGEPALATAMAMELAKALVLFCAVVGLASAPHRVRIATTVMVAAGTLLAVLGVFQTATGDFGNSFGGLARIKYAHIHGAVFEPRIAGPIGDPNFFAQILIPLVPLALALAWGTRNPRLRAAAFAAAGVLIAGTVLTYSRGAAVALAVVLALSLLAHGVRPRRLAAGLILLLLLVPLAPDGFARRLTTIAQVLPGSEEVLRPDSSFGKRRVVTGVAWRMFVDRPLLGVGAGNYTTRFHDYVEEVGSAVREYEADEAHYAHSLYLEIAAETGALGLLAFGAVLVVCFVSLRRARDRFRDRGLEPHALLARGVEIALVGYLASSVFLHGHHVRYLWLLFALAAALHAVSSVPARRQATA
jgi:putative inorganic carbon (hco3(-)) transporter